jgi:hypothetical protein
MKYAPHAYQAHATEKVLNQSAVGLFLEMGLGKTVATLTAVDDLMYDRFDVRRVLVIAPLRVAQHTWLTEARKWDHLKSLRISRVLGSAAERRAALACSADIYVINRENVEWLVDELGETWPFDMVVIDELSSFKNKSSKRFKALKKVRGKIKRIVGLTGTPSPNGLLDLWAQVWLLDEGQALGRTYTVYQNAWFMPDKRNSTQIFSWKPRPGAENEIYDRLDGLCVSMEAKDWLELPERIDNIITVDLDASARAQYNQLERDSLLPFAGGDIEAKSAAALTTKLLQLAGGAVYDESGGWTAFHDAKIKAVEEIVEAQQGKPVIIYYSFKHELVRLQTSFPKAVKLNTEKDIDAWNRGEIEVLLAHPASAGHGLNLQAGGNTIIWFGLPWSLELYQQANARLHRQGQTQSVIVHHVITANTIDSEVLDALQNKAAGQDTLLTAVKARLDVVLQSAEALSEAL